MARVSAYPRRCVGDGVSAGRRRHALPLLDGFIRLTLAKMDGQKALCGGEGDVQKEFYAAATSSLPRGEQTASFRSEVTVMDARRRARVGSMDFTLSVETGDGQVRVGAADVRQPLG